MLFAEDEGGVDEVAAAIEDWNERSGEEIRKKQ
jgi:hypothetical protein